MRILYRADTGFRFELGGGGVILLQVTTPTTHTHTHTGDAEISDLGQQQGVVHEDVPALQVAVQNAGFMQHLQAARHAAAQVELFVDGESTPLQKVMQRAPVGRDMHAAAVIARTSFSACVGYSYDIIY